MLYRLALQSKMASLDEQAGSPGGGGEARMDESHTAGDPHPHPATAGEHDLVATASALTLKEETAKVARIRDETRLDAMKLALRHGDVGHPVGRALNRAIGTSGHPGPYRRSILRGGG